MDRVEPQKPRGFAKAAADQAKAGIEQGAGVTARALADVADAVRRVGDDLEQREQGFGAQIARGAASGLATLAGAVSDRSADEMLDAVRDFARRHPTTFLAAAAFSGFALGRFAGAAPDADMKGAQGNGAGSTFPVADASAAI